MRVSSYFINREGVKNPNNDKFFVKAKSGRYGVYAKMPSGLNYSEKKMIAKGWELASFNAEEAKKLEDLQIKKWHEINLRHLEYELNKRAEQVDICLKSEALPLVDNDGENRFVAKVVNLGGTPMIEAYHGCGKGTAYVKKDHVIAFHYGHKQPSNAPKAEVFLVEMSGCQICF